MVALADPCSRTLFSSEHTPTGAFGLSCAPMWTARTSSSSAGSASNNTRRSGRPRLSRLLGRTPVQASGNTQRRWRASPKRPLGARRRGGRHARRYSG